MVSFSSSFVILATFEMIIIMVLKEFQSSYINKIKKNLIIIQVFIYLYILETSEFVIVDRNFVDLQCYTFENLNDSFMKNINKACFLHNNFYIIFIRKPCIKVELRTKKRPYP